MEEIGKHLPQLIQSRLGVILKVLEIFLKSCVLSGIFPDLENLMLMKLGMTLLFTLQGIYFVVTLLLIIVLKTVMIILTTLLKPLFYDLAL